MFSLKHFKLKIFPVKDMKCIAIFDLNNFASEALNFMQITCVPFFESTRQNFIFFRLIICHHQFHAQRIFLHLLRNCFFAFKLMKLLTNLLAFLSRFWNVFKRKQLKLEYHNYLQLPPEIVLCLCHLSIVCFAPFHFVEMKFLVKLAENMSPKDRNNRKQLCNNEDEAQKSLKHDRQNLEKFENLISWTKKKTKKLEVSANITFHKDSSKHKRDLLCSLTDNYLLFGSILRLLRSHSARSNRDCPENRKSYRFHRRFNGLEWWTCECELAS